MPEVERVFVSMSFTLRCLAQDAKPLFLLTCWPGTVPALMLAPPVRKGLQSPLLAEPFCKRNRYNGIPTLTAFLCLDPLIYTLLFSEACLCLFLPSTANTLCFPVISCLLGPILRELGSCFYCVCDPRVENRHSVVFGWMNAGRVF